jgi:preprotein translocase subunit SecA
MFNSSLAATTGIMRPGLTSGSYPERDDQDSGWIDQSFNSLLGTLSRLSIDRRTPLHKVVNEINSKGEALTTLDSVQLDNLRIELRRLFRSRGLNPSLCIRAFALIREISTRAIHLRHYDSQLMGGWVMLHGQLAEMETGEGKTLAATLAAATAAIAGIPVHIITVNEYLVERDAKAMSPLYRSLGLSVGYITHGMTPEECRTGYACDITYCTNKQVAFDYLRDRLLLGNNRSQLRLHLEPAYTNNNRLGQLLLRGLCFAIVDEADSVLIDEARTPLILTRNVDSEADHKAYRQALELARQLEIERDFFLDTAQCDVQLSLPGQQKLAGLPLSKEGLWQNARRREELVCQALHALHLLQKDQDYLVCNEKILIIDANTGRTMPDRSWERGLHQLVEAKENCPLTKTREQLGRLTYQRFFRRYLRLGGMTGTAREVSSELWAVYGLRVRKIPLNRPSQRRELPTRIYQRAEEKWDAVIKSVTDMQEQGRPVLIGTSSVADSEMLSRKLTAFGIDHRTLNARQDKEEAEIVAQAGKQKQVTVATNMAGRGTDIPLGNGVVQLGGLHVIAACRYDAKRIDRQLAGRCARQGDPGSYESILSLEDELIRKNCCPALIKILNYLTTKGDLFHNKLNRCVIRRIQLRMEHRHKESRKALLKHERETGRLLAFSGYLE